MLFSYFPGKVIFVGMLVKDKFLRIIRAEKFTSGGLGVQGTEVIKCLFMRNSSVDKILKGKDIP